MVILKKYVMCNKLDIYVFNWYILEVGEHLFGSSLLSLILYGVLALSGCIVNGV